jgi:aminoglycoside phosphotransferase (APT) family kinase protein
LRRIDPLPILAGLGIGQPGKVTPISGGWDTSLWRVDDGEHAYALRVFRPEQAQTCHREAVVMRALGDFGLPVPAVHAEGSTDGVPALLLGWCPGRPVLQEIRASPWRIWRLGVAMGRVHARIHAVDVSDALERALTAVPQIEDTSTRLSVLHLDYHPLNVMTNGNAITGVLDWANVAVGDRRVDLARTVTLLRLAPLPPGTPSVVGAALRAALELAWRRGYRGRQTTDPFEGMEPFYIWAGAMMERDLRPKLGKPGVWLQESDLLHIHRWTMSRRPRVPTSLSSSGRK